MMDTPLHATRRAAALELYLNRPERRNALSRALIESLTEAVEQAGRDGGVRALVLTGTAPAFCAGLDLEELGQGAAGGGVWDTSALLGLYEVIERCPKAVIAAVNGPAAAGGAGLALACDVVVCGSSASMGFPGVVQGLVAPIVMPPLIRAAGERRARYLLLTGEMLSAEACCAAGLADEVVLDSGLMARAGQLADRLGAAAATVAVTKQKLIQLRKAGLGRNADAVRRISSEMLLTEGAAEALARFRRT